MLFKRHAATQEKKKKTNWVNQQKLVKKKKYRNQTSF